MVVGVLIKGKINVKWKLVSGSSKGGGKLL